MPFTYRCEAVANTSCKQSMGVEGTGRRAAVGGERAPSSLPSLSHPFHWPKHPLQPAFFYICKSQNSVMAHKAVAGVLLLLLAVAAASAAAPKHMPLPAPEPSSTVANAQRLASALQGELPPSSRRTAWQWSTGRSYVNRRPRRRWRVTCQATFISLHAQARPSNPLAPGVPQGSVAEALAGPCREMVLCDAPPCAVGPAGPPRCPTPQLCLDGCSCQPICAAPVSGFIACVLVRMHQRQCDQWEEGRWALPRLRSPKPLSSPQQLMMTNAAVHRFLRCRRM